MIVFYIQECAVRTGDLNNSG